MFKENKIATISFILIFTILIGVLIYTPFYLKENKENLTQEPNPKEPESTPVIEESEPKESEPVETPIEEEKPKEDKKEEIEVEKEPINLKLTLEINKTKYTVNLIDNDTTRELIKRLPLEITMNELNGNEKYYRFDKPLPNDPKSINKINRGELMLYEDNTLVLFYDTFDTIYNYTKIGKIEDDTMLKTNLGKKESKIKIYQ